MRRITGFGGKIVGLDFSLAFLQGLDTPASHLGVATTVLALSLIATLAPASKLQIHSFRKFVTSSG